VTWSRLALRSALVATAVAAALALTAGGVRILPWLLDPRVTWRVAAPFARSVFALAGEAALAVGWPIGWALAAQAFVERGEARVLRLLGERPLRTALRLSPQGAVLAAALVALSFASARESGEPGRIVTELINDGQAACRNADTPTTYVVPFFGAAWLCAPGLTPRLAGQGPGRLASLVFSADGARASGDLSQIELDDANLALPHASIHVGRLRLTGASPWGHAEAIGAWSRALALTLSVALSAWAAVVLLLRGAAGGRVGALVIGGAGPIAALGALRGIERLGGAASADGWRGLLIAMVPIAAVGAPTVLAAALAWAVSRLPLGTQAARSK
jgi:hypothetical protein